MYQFLDVIHVDITRIVIIPISLLFLFANFFRTKSGWLLLLQWSVVSVFFFFNYYYYFFLSFSGFFSFLFKKIIKFGRDNYRAVGIF